MPRSLTGGLLGGLALLAASCDGQSELIPLPGSPPGYPYSYAVADCAPWDGPAVTLYLTATPADSTAFTYPQLRLSVYRGATSLAGNTFAWPAETQVAAATRCFAAADCQAAASGRISFRARDPDGALRGSFDLSFTDGTALRGGFRAVWRDSRAVCG